MKRAAAPLNLEKDHALSSLTFQSNTLVRRRGSIDWGHCGECHEARTGKSTRRGVADAQDHDDARFTKIFLGVKGRPRFGFGTTNNVPRGSTLRLSTSLACSTRC